MRHPDRHNDAELAQLARDDATAFDTLYRRHVTAIYRFCYARSNSIADTEDLTAQTFLAALDTLDSYEGRGSFRGWLFGIARHKCADLHRSRRRQVEASLEDAVSFGTAVPGRSDPGPAPEEAARDALLLDCVKRMLPQLSPARQEAVQLRYWGNLELEEVAGAMGRSVAAVKMLISRGIADLRKRCPNA